MLKYLFFIHCTKIFFYKPTKFHICYTVCINCVISILKSCLIPTFFRCQLVGGSNHGGGGSGGGGHGQPAGHGGHHSRQKPNCRNGKSRPLAIRRAESFHHSRSLGDFDKLTRDDSPDLFGSRSFHYSAYDNETR